MEFLRLGEYTGTKTERLEHVAELWRSGGFKVLIFDGIHKMVWQKLICNVTYSGTCTLTGLTIAQVQASQDAWSVAYVKALGEKIPGARPSMLLDYLAGRRCEIDVINGAIPREGQRVDVPTPINDVVCALIRGKETTFG